MSDETIILKRRIEGALHYANQVTPATSGPFIRTIRQLLSDVLDHGLRAEVPSPSPEPTETIMSDWASPPPEGEAERTFTLQQVHDIVGWVTGKPGLEALINKAIDDYLAVRPERPPTCPTASE